MAYQPRTRHTDRQLTGLLGVTSAMSTGKREGSLEKLPGSESKEKHIEKLLNYKSMQRQL